MKEQNWLHDYWLPVSWQMIVEIHTHLRDSTIDSLMIPHEHISGRSVKLFPQDIFKKCARVIKSWVFFMNGVRVHDSIVGASGTVHAIDVKWMKLRLGCSNGSCLKVSGQEVPCPNWAQYLSTWPSQVPSRPSRFVATRFRYSDPISSDSIILSCHV